MKPLLVMLAGPNGAGKTTFYESFLSDLGLPFLNADVLAAEIGMGAYEAAAQIAEVRQILIAQRVAFISETVLSDPIGAKIEFLENAVVEGFDVHLIYIGIADAALSVERVKSRLKAGGHDVPVDKILARYERTLANLDRAIASLPRVTLYENSSFEEPFRLIAEFRSGKLHQNLKGSIPGWARRFFGEG